jgi:hypothetical protein
MASCGTTGGFLTARLLDAMPMTQQRGRNRRCAATKAVD